MAMTDVEFVRQLIGDVVVSDQLFTDSQIADVIAISTGLHFAAAVLCDMAAARFARSVDKSISETSISASQKLAHYKRLAADLRRNGSDGTGVTTAGMIVGGISSAERGDLLNGDSDRITPSFRIGQDDNPGALYDGGSATRWGR